MLAVVRAPRMQKVKPVCFSIQGDVPEYVMKYLRSKFSDIRIVDTTPVATEESNEDELINWEESDLHKEIRSQMTPGGNLKLLRTTFKMTQRELAEKTGVAVQAISAMERGRAPIGRKMAHKLADALGTSYENLFW